MGILEHSDELSWLDKSSSWSGLDIPCTMEVCLDWEKETRSESVLVLGDIVYVLCVGSVQT